jgi:predicted dehydrogenase
MKLKIGIAGYGIIGKRRRQNIDKNESMETVAVCDQNFKHAELLNDGVRCYPDYQQLLNEEDLDVLFVSLPNYLAPEVTIAGLDKGLHVFCEKPPGRNVNDVLKVLETKQKYPSLNLKYGFNHRYHDSVRDALKILNSKELGEVINLRGVYGKNGFVPFGSGWRAERLYAGGGILLDQGIHMVDLIQLFCGDFPVVQGCVTNNYWKCDVEDNAFAIMRNPQGKVAMLHSTATQWQHLFSLNIFFTEGYLRLSGILSGSKSYGQEKLIIGRRNKLATGSDREETITYLEDNSWRDEVNEFADAIITEKPVKSGTVEEAVATMKQVYRIYWADTQWREMWNIPNPDAK